MIRRAILAVLLFILAFPVFSQIENPVHWKTEWKKLSGNEIELTFTADVDPGWYIYSQYLESDDGPIRTSFHYENGSHFQLVGKCTEEGKRKEGFDEIFNMDVIKFSGKTIFRQRVKVLNPKAAIKGYLEFMTCDNDQCLPPTEVDFNFDVSAAGTAAAAPAQEEKAALPAQAGETPLLQADQKESQPGILEPVKWKASIRQIAGPKYLLTLTASMEPGWTIYSQFTEPNGPLPTEFFFDKSAGYQRVGQVIEEGKKKEAPDPLFGGVMVKKFASSPVVFTQEVEVSDPRAPITGFVSFMTCNDKQCIPVPEMPFRFLPETLEAFTGPDASQAGGNVTAPSQSEEALNTLYGGMPVPDLGNPEGACSEQEVRIQSNTGLGKIFILGFLGGLLALLTPCVFPMIPLTVSFFTKSNTTRKKAITQASLYGFFILLVYLLLSIPFHLMDSINPDILNDISTNIWLNILFFAIFLVFAFSFFGYYELTLPSSWTNRAASAEGVGGLVGIFFMAITLALVSFSCTGPILGSLLAGALTSDGGAWQLTTGMAGFGLALALPFALFAAFPGMMKSLPKSGGWLNTVKVVLGFLELALALKFLSNADLVKHWEILTIEPFLALWLLTFLGLALYLFGVIRFPHDSPGKRPMGQILLGLASLAFTVYLATGFLPDPARGSYRSLKLLSGLAPPVCYSWFNPCDCPQNLSCFKDLQEGMAYAQKMNKPVMLDFTGHACVNCRKMEEHVWPESPVYAQLKDDYVLISLYVDDRRELPEDQRLEVETVTGGVRKLRTVGQKWSHFQTTYFKTNSQPFYVLLSPDGRLLNNPVGYTPDVQEYADFLKCGKDAFSRLAEK
ncbi:MAG: thioredoxin family protein [Haliscomenobacter sp.]|nr:thioredoxin family protein [Haliscomenobacter sp.]